MSHRPDGVDVVTEMNLSYYERGQTKPAICSLLEYHIRSSDLFVTLAWNRNRASSTWGKKPTLYRPKIKLSILTAHHDLDEFVKRIDSHCLGSRFHKKPTELRCTLVGVPEHFSSNLHYHGILRPGRFRHGEDLRHYIAECQRIWKFLVPGGSVDIQLAGKFAFDERRYTKSKHPEALCGPHRIVRYIVKASALPGAAEGLFVAGRFHEFR